MRVLTKAEAIEVIHKSALLFSENLENKNVIFIGIRESQVEYYETIFLPNNYKHLTGVESKLSGERFYRAAFGERLHLNDIELPRDGTAALKLSVLPRLMNIHTNAKMIGTYNDSQPLLITDKLVGNIDAVLGFRKDNGYYLPNTALKEDIRKISVPPLLRVAAIFVKNRRDEKYGKCTYVAKGIELNDPIFAEIINEKVQLAGST